MKRTYTIGIVLILLPTLFIVQCKKEVTVAPSTTTAATATNTYTLTPYAFIIPTGFSTNTQSQNDNPLTVEGVALGKELYFDPILSNNGKSCSSCHAQSQSFTLSSVNSLPPINLAWNNNFLWEGGIEGNVESVMKFEVEVFFKTQVSKLNASADYKEKFKKVFNVDTISSKQIAYALAQYARTLVSANSKYDKWLRNEVQLDSAELRGYNMFFTEKADCFHCHGNMLCTDNLFHNIGLDAFPTGGHFNTTGNNNDAGKYKTPTLRNIVFTAPYMHDGRFTTLEQVVDFYSEGLKYSATIDPLMKKVSSGGVRLTSQEKSDLIAFLKTLTDTDFITNPAFVP